MDTSFWVWMNFSSLNFVLNCIKRSLHFFIDTCKCIWQIVSYKSAFNLALFKQAQHENVFLRKEFDIKPYFFPILLRRQPLSKWKFYYLFLSMHARISLLDIFYFSTLWSFVASFVMNWKCFIFYARRLIFPSCYFLIIKKKTV